MSQNKFVLSDGFWKEFREKYWKKKPTVIRQPFGGPLISSEEVYNSFLKATMGFSGNATKTTFHRGFTEVSTGRREYFPHPSEKNFNAYMERIKKRVKTEPFGVNIEKFQTAIGWEFTDNLRRFLDKLYTFAGVPADRAELYLFCGDYKVTPVGVHRDSGDAFCMAVDVPKKMRVWPKDVIDSRSYKPEIVNYDHIMDKSELLVGQPGDVIYWPDTYWHVGEGDGEAGMSLSLLLYYVGSQSKQMAPQIEREMKTAFAEADSVEMLPFNSETLPSKINDALKALEENLTSDNYRDKFTVNWLNQLSAHGFDRMPPYEDEDAPPVTLAESDFVQGDRLLPIRKFVNGEVLYVAMNGKTIRLPNDNRLSKLVDIFNEGARHKVSEVIASVEKEEKDRKTLFKFVELLFKFRGVLKT